MTPFLRSLRESPACRFSSSESSSSNETSSTTENVDRRIAATDSAIVVSLDEGASLALTDPGVIDAAAGVLKSFEQVLDKSLSFSTKAVDRGFDLASDVLEKNRSEAAQGLEQVIKAGVTVAVVGLAAWGLPKVFK